MAIIVGHSQVKYLSDYITDPRIFTLCYSGYTIGNILEDACAFDAIREASVVSLMIGANDIPQDDTEQVLANLQQLCEKIHVVNPGISVHISAILPRGDNRFPRQRLSETYLQEFNDTAREVNNVLREVARLVPWVEFTDHPEFVATDGHINREMLSRDGLHLSYEGTTTVAGTLELKLSTQLANILSL